MATSMIPDAFTYNGACRRYADIFGRRLDARMKEENAAATH